MAGGNGWCWVGIDVKGGGVGGRVQLVSVEGAAAAWRR